MGKDSIIEDFKSFIEEFRTESDRAIVVLTAARIDYLLLALLNKYLIPNTSKGDEFFANDGPAATFSNKIQLAYRLGLIDKEFTRCLNQIRRIRNDFAHESSKCSLDKGSHKDQVLSLISNYKNLEIFSSTRELYFKNESDMRAKYMTLIGFLIIRLGYLIEKIDPVNESNSWPLVSDALKQWTNCLPVGNSVLPEG